MLVTVIIWVYLTFIFLTYGVGGLVLIRRVMSIQKAVLVSLPLVVTLGLGINAWISSVLSLAMKLGLAAHLLILAGACLILFFQYGELKRQIFSGIGSMHWMIWALVVLAFITTVLYAVKIPENPDTPLYHAQAIHWIEEYPAVPGLGNLEPRLGSNSNWFTLAALFSFSFLGSRSFHLVPSFLFLVSVFYLLSGLQKLLKGDFRFSQIVKLGFIPLAFYVLIDEISSPGTDLPVILFYWLILCLWLETIEENNPESHSRLILYFFSVLVITFKMSGITILLVAFLFLVDLLRKKEYRALSTYIVLAVLVLLPWLIRNFILTGYWLYPEPMMQVFSPHVDWMIPVDKVLAFKTGVKTWALSPGTQLEDVAGFSLLHKLGYWFSNLTLNQKGLSIVGLISPVLFGIFSYFTQNTKKIIALFPVVFVGYMSFLFWLFTAPNFRFGYGFVLGMVVLAFVPIVKYALERYVHYGMYPLMAIALVLFVQQVNIILGSVRDDTRYTEYQILPADYPNVPTDACSLDGENILCAHKWRQCSYHAFPCLPQIPRNVELRGDTFSDGFYRIQTDQ
jgi:hypothetical protein